MKLPLFLLILAASTHAQNTQVKACAVLPPAPPATGTSRIQQALNLCSPGEAVILKSGARNSAFHSAPLILPRGVTLYIDSNVTLYASRNPRDYDLAPGSCGAAPSGNAARCKPFLYSYQAAYSGVAGGGTVDGQGAAGGALFAPPKNPAGPSPSPICFPATNRKASTSPE